MPPLPSLVFEHFRAPRHQGALGGGVRVELEGRREDAWVRLYLRERPDGTLEASYELEGDRSPVAALSLLATWVQGRPRAEVEALTLEDLAAHYELPFDLWPSLVLPLDALSAALARLRGAPCPFGDEGELVCHCLHVRERRLRRAIRERGLRTVEEVRFWTRACSGCRSCRDEVAGLLAEEGRAADPR